MTTATLTIRGARLHNLKDVSLEIPRNQFVVLAGPSGSDKSTPGCDILRAEGQRQCLQALGLIPCGTTRPPVDALSGLAPTVSIDQHRTNRSPRSTVGTASDIYTYLRVLFARPGQRTRPALLRPCQRAMGGRTWRAGRIRGRRGDVSLSALRGARAHGPFLFQQAGRGLLDEQKSLPGGAVVGWDLLHIAYHTATLQAACAHYGLAFASERAVKDYTPSQHGLLLFGVQSPLFRRHFPTIEPPETVRQGRFEGIATSLLRRYGQHLHEHMNEAEYRDRPESLAIRAQIVALTRPRRCCAG